MATMVQHTAGNAIPHQRDVQVQAGVQQRIQQQGIPDGKSKCLCLTMRTLRGRHLSLEVLVCAKFANGLSRLMRWRSSKLVAAMEERKE